MKIGIVGAGLSGIIAARELIERGHAVELIEKSRSVGGRLATRRIGEGKADHGAVYFTVRGEDLKQDVQAWMANGWVTVWYADPYPRYVATGGMNHLAKHLAEGLPVHLNEQVEAIKAENGMISVHTNKTIRHYEKLLVTTPLPQTFELLGQLSQDMNQSLRTLSYAPTFVGLFEFMDPIKVGTEGIIDQHLERGLLKVINNRQKGISTTNLVSVYMDEAWSESWYARSSEETLQEIERLLKTVTGEAKIASKQLKRWRYAQAREVWRAPYDRLKQHPVFLAGDVFLEPDDPSGRTRFESAYISGLRAAEAMDT